MVYKVFIPENCPSSKNGKVWTGKRLVWSKAAQKYRKKVATYLEENSVEFRKHIDKEELPAIVHFKFVRGTKHQFDYVNPLQTILDLMVEHNWIPDDNSDVILPVFEPYEYNKECPGVEISLIST